VVIINNMRTKKVIEKQDLEHLRIAEEQIDESLDARYYTYKPQKSYVNKFERLATVLHVSPTKLAIDKHTGRVIRLSKSKAKAKVMPSNFRIAAAA